MPQITPLRVLFTSANLHPSPLLPSSLSSLFKPKSSQTPVHTPHRSFFTILSSSSKQYSNRSPSHNFTRTRRNQNTLSSVSGDRNKNLAMEETSEQQSIGFNKKRADGGDRNPKKNLQLKVRKLNPVNTISYIQILGTGMDTQDTSPAVLLFFDKQRFIFNAGEGLQRFCTEHKIKLSKIDHIFLSRVCSETAGGLPGLLLTLAGMGDEGMAVNVWGPSDLKYLVDAMKSFIPNAAMVHTRSFGPLTGSAVVSNPHPQEFVEPLVLVDDEVVKISAIILRPCCSDMSELSLGESMRTTAGQFSPENRRDLSSDGLLSHCPERKPELAGKPGDMSVIYLCELPEIKGKFDPEKAKALGLKPGPKYRELQLGNPVMSDHQKIMVHPSDVLGPSLPGPVVLLVDCPTLLHLHKLLSIQSLSSYYASNSHNPAESSKVVNCVIHLSPASIISTSDYQKWMSRFGGAQHIMAGHEMKNIEVPILKASARVAARLNYLCPQFFPAPGFWSCENLKCSIDGSRSSSEGPFSVLCKSVPAENLLKFHLRPYAQLGLDRSGVPNTITSLEIVHELLSEVPEISDAAQQINKLWHGDKELREKLTSEIDDKVLVEGPWLNENGIPSCLEDITREDMEIVLLGTGSSQPSKYRNVSSIFMNLFSKGSLLLDCGEGTLGQLKRRFGIEGADDAVRNLRCIWISHIHADHHTGLARILALRHNLLKAIAHEPIIVIGPRQLKRYLDAYQRLEDLDMEFLDCRHTTEASLEAFASKQQISSTPQSNFDDINNRNAAGIMNQCLDSTLFAEGSRMQSYLKRQGSPFDTGVAFPILKKLKKILGEAGLESLESFPVVHCPDAFGVVITAADRINSVGKTMPGWKIVYSGDTRPCPKLVEVSRGATVLIHEATFEDGLQDEAEARNHSTTKEAIELGNSAGTYRIILTHFSQRYPKIPVFDETHMHKTCIAFDMMSVNLADLPVLPKVLPYLKLLFRNEMVIDESEEVEADVVTAVG